MTRRLVKKDLNKTKLPGLQIEGGADWLKNWMKLGLIQNYFCSLKKKREKSLAISIVS